MANRVFLVGAILLAGLTFAAGCGQRSQGAGPTPAAPPPEVVVSKPVARLVTDYFEFPGQTAAVGEVEVRARVTGYLVKVNFEDGQDVKKGDLLYEIDPRPYQAALDRAKGELARLYALLERAKTDVARSERLRPSGAVSQDDYEQRKANLKVHLASIEMAKAAVRDAELNLEYTKITSPIDGRVSRTRITEGNLVQPGTNDAAVLTTVVTRNPIYVYFNVDEQALLKYQRLAFRQGKELHPKRLKDLKFPIEIGLANEEGFPHAGIIDFADNKVDRTTGTLRVRGLFENDKEYLTPGLFVRVRIPFGDPHRSLLVPEDAVSRDQRERFLLIVNKKNEVEFRKVEAGSLRDRMMVIESGIGPDDWVIVKGLQRARPGIMVTPRRLDKKDVAGSQSPPPVTKTAGRGKTT
ncbi:MAG: efflux RND transporter periplasmic adaptor subunit [Thermoguttaceae bacterium]